MQNFRELPLPLFVSHSQQRCVQTLQEIFDIPSGDVELLAELDLPGLFERYPRPHEPADLAHHVLLCSLHGPNDWPDWLKAAKVPHIDGNSGLKFENSALAYQAAIDELGIVMAQYAYVADDLRSGRLVGP